ncbi:MAG: PDZ domain-containing protein [Bacteroidetes bacterium]|nr:PDZ domain-containing protein [Bacteroidota bacterium]
MQRGTQLNLCDLIFGRHICSEMKYLILLSFFTINSMRSTAEILYRVSFPEAASHYVHVELVFVNSKKEDVIIKMPVWTPGSYKVREFSQNIDRFEAEVAGKKCTVERADKNSWLLKNCPKGEVRFQYDVYAFELGVRTSYVDLQKAFLHGASVFVYVEGKEKDTHKVQVTNLNEWKNLFVALPFSNPNTFTCSNYDLLVDSPVACGNFDSTTYKSGGTEHTVVMIGKGSYDLKIIKKDFKKICDSEVNMFGGKHPSPTYIHFIQNVDAGGGGLEHLNCQTSQVNRWAYSDEKKYKAFLGLIAHEYFHLWNVKRIRPVELGPFNYNQENYTDMLWMAEGITSYYDDLTLLRTGIHTPDSYLEVLASSMNRLENKPGKEIMSLTEASRLAWIKAYLPNENSENVTISYYNKGLLVAWLIDLKILKTTEGKKRLDDVMRELYHRYQKFDKGIVMSEFISVCNEVSGIDFTQFFDDYVYGLKALPYEEMIQGFHLELKNQVNEDKADLGIKTKTEGGKCVISFVRFGSPAVAAGLSVNDEIMAIDGWRVKGDLTEELTRIKPEKQIEILYSRDGAVSSTILTTAHDSTASYHLTLSENTNEADEDLRKIWLGL